MVEQWDEIESAYLQDRTPRKIHEDLPVALRTLRDLLDHRVGVVRVDDPKVRLDVAAFIDQFGVDFCGELRDVESSISRELESSLAVETVHDKRVNLPSGGYIVIEKTEAMTTIDVIRVVISGRRIFLLQRCKRTLRQPLQYQGT